MLTGGGALLRVLYSVSPTSMQPLTSAFCPLWFCTDNQSLVQHPRRLVARRLLWESAFGGAAAGIRARQFTHPAHAAPAEPCPNVLEQ